jgi:hypothetical protein
VFAANRLRLAIRAIAFTLLFAASASAHVGSPDIFFQAKAGPYPLLIAIRPPDVIPGVATIEVRSQGPGVRQILLTPTPMTGEASKHPPVADIATASTADPQYFEGSLWLMQMGSWMVHIHAKGVQGEGELVVPVPAVATRIKPMSSGVGYFLAGMMLFLVAGLVSITGAAVREAQLEPGAASPRWTRKTSLTMMGTALLLAFVLWRGNVWWAEDAAFSQKRLFKPLGITAEVKEAHAEFRLQDPGWIRQRKLDDLIPDHGHLMHLFLVRWPNMDEVFHLHPEQTAAGFFDLDLPSLPAGEYRIFGDVVHENGFAETAVGQVTLPEIHGKPLTGDDAGGAATKDLGKGYSMVRVQDKTMAVRAKQVTLFSFAIQERDGKLADDMEPYMGMGGHAEFVKRDGTVFAHVHPTGSVSMASVAVASPAQMAAMHEGKVGPVVSFPFGVPTPGEYRIFVQMKRAGKVETGTFDLEVK